MKDISTDIMQGLKALGIVGKVTIIVISYRRVKVYVDEEYIGIWDADRRTFVD